MLARVASDTTLDAAYNGGGTIQRMTILGRFGVTGEMRKGAYRQTSLTQVRVREQ
jgi:hypothetical protein